MEEVIPKKRTRVEERVITADVTRGNLDKQATKKKEQEETRPISRRAYERRAHKIAIMWAERLIQKAYQKGKISEESIENYILEYTSKFVAISMLSEEELSKLGSILFQQGMPLRVPERDIHDNIIGGSKNWDSKSKVKCLHNDECVFSLSRNVRVKMSEVVLCNLDMASMSLSNDSEFGPNLGIELNYLLAKEYIAKKYQSK